MKDKSLQVSGIYALIDPISGDIRYVGQSKNIYNRFYYGHLTQGKRPNYPVSNWIAKLESLNLKPEIKVLEEHNDPASIEAEWITKIKQSGANLLNLHAGGAIPAVYGNGKTTKIWSVEGMTSPWIMLCRSLNGRGGKSKDAINLKEQLKEIRKSKKTEYEILRFELACAKAMMDNLWFGLDRVRLAEEWVIKVADQVNAKYPETVIVMGADGVRIK